MLRNIFTTMAEEMAAKRVKMTPPLIGTHNGHFHADEALAVYLLRLLPTYRNAPLVRTRDPSILATCHTVVDVGGEYDAANNRYDHHQRTFAATFPGRATKLSSAGLVYLHFGQQVIAARTGLSEAGPVTKLVWEKLYADFVEALDAHDNGISAYDPDALAAMGGGGGIKKRFDDGGVTLGSLVSDLNHAFEVDDDPFPTAVAAVPGHSQAEEDARFQQASRLMGTTFLRKLAHVHTAWLPARDEVQRAYTQRFDVDSSGAIVVLEGGSVPWKDHLYTFEAADGKQGGVLYVLYPEGPDKESCRWRVQCVPVARDSFQSRRPLREEWRGVRDEELSKLSGIDGCVFVHAGGFIGGNATRAGAMEMARRSIAS